MHIRRVKQQNKDIGLQTFFLKWPDHQHHPQHGHGHDRNQELC